MEHSRWLWFSLLVFLFLSAVESNREAHYREDITVTNSRQYITLGGLFPITVNKNNGQCKEVRNSAVERVEAMVFAIGKINSDTSILPDVNLTFDIRDTCTIPNFALEQVLDYVHNSDVFCNNETILAISGILGGALTSVSQIVANLIRLFQIPQISYGSTAALLSDKSKFDYFFRTIPPDVLQVKAMADLIVHFNWTYIFALYSDDIYGRDGIDSLISELKARNVTRTCMALREALPLGQSNNNNGRLGGVVKAMNQDWVKNASVAVLFGHPDQAIGILRAILNKTNSDSYLHNITWIASDSWGQVLLPEDIRHMVRGMFGFVPAQDTVVEFDDYFTSLNPDSYTANPWFSQYWESVFDCNLDNKSNSTTCETQNQRISFNTTKYVQPAQTRYVIDAIYAFAAAIHQMILDYCPSGILCDEIITMHSVGEAINGEILRNYLFNVSLPSASSNQRLFDSNGDVQGLYMIKNLKMKEQDNDHSIFVFDTIGTWDQTNFLQLTGDIEWNNQNNEVPQSLCSLPCTAGHQPELLSNQEPCCWLCQPCLGENSVSSGNLCYNCEERFMPNQERSRCVAIPVTFFTWSSPWAITILSLTSIGIVATSFIGVVFVIFHKHKVIKASSRELSAILLGGILLCYILPFFFAAKPSLTICAIRRFAVGFCFAIGYSALLVRTNRIHRIFNQASAKIGSPPRFISTPSQIAFTCILISIQVVIAILWLAIENPSVKTVLIDSRTLELRCGESPYIGLPVSLVYNLFLLIFSTYFAFCTRNVPDNFNEAKFINVTLYTLCIIWVAFVPTYFVTIQFGSTYENFFLLLAIFLSASTTLICLLVPKVFIVFTKLLVKKIEPGMSSSKATTGSTKVADVHKLSYQL